MSKSSSRELLARLVGFATVSRESNLELILHLHAGHGVVLEHSHSHRSPFAVTQGIGQQIGHHLLNPELVPLSRYRLATLQFEMGFQGRGLCREILHEPSHQLRQVERLGSDRSSAARMASSPTAPTRSSSVASCASTPPRPSPRWCTWTATTPPLPSLRPSRPVSAEARPWRSTR